MIIAVAGEYFDIAEAAELQFQVDASFRDTFAADGGGRLESRPCGIFVTGPDSITGAACFEPNPVRCEL